MYLFPGKVLFMCEDAQLNPDVCFSMVIIQMSLSTALIIDSLCKNEPRHCNEPTQTQTIAHLPLRRTHPGLLP